MKNKISSLEKTVNTLSDKISELQELKEKMSLLEKKINDDLNKEEDIEFINKEIYITKKENETKLIEVNDISFKNIGKKVFSGKDNLYFYKGEESSDGIYFNQNIKSRYRKDIILNEDLVSLKVSNGHKIILQIEKPEVGKTYFFFLYIKSELKEIKMKYPFRVIINIINDKQIKDEQLINRQILEKKEKEEKEKEEKEEKKEKEKEEKEEKKEKEKEKK